VWNTLISAGTIAAYLELDTKQFNRGLGEAMQRLIQFAQSGSLGQAAMVMLGHSAGSTANMLNGSFIGAVGESTRKFWKSAQSYIASMSGVSYNVAVKAGETRKSLLSIGDNTGEVAAKSRAVAAAIKAPFQSLSSSAYTVMSNVGAGLNRGLADKRSLILSTAKNIANSVVGTLRSVLKIASPSKVMRQIGEYTAQGLAIGIETSVPDVERSAQALARSITDRRYAPSGTGGQGDVLSLAGRLDSLISLLSDSEQVMMVDGRAFARLIREYS